MTIKNINVNYTGQVGILPRTVKVHCDDSYATVTSAGYLNSSAVQGFNYLPEDVFFVSYAGNAFGIFLPSFNGNIITLRPWVNSGNVVLPVVSGDFASFSGTTGLIADSGIAPSNPAKIIVASVNGATTIGDVATFADIKGTIQNSGVLLSSLQVAANIKAFNYSYAGGSATATVALTGVTTSSIAVAELATSTNPAVVNFVKILSTNQLTIVFSADPGVSTINIIAFIAAQ